MVDLFVMILRLMNDRTVEAIYVEAKDCQPPYAFLIICLPSRREAATLVISTMGRRDGQVFFKTD